MEFHNCPRVVNDLKCGDQIDKSKSHEPIICFTVKHNLTEWGLVQWKKGLDL